MLLEESPIPSDKTTPFVTKDGKHILVTGGAGFIGSHTVDMLLDCGYSVRVLDDLSSGSLNNLPRKNPRLEFVQGDVRDAGTVMEVAQGAQACLHLAAQVSVQKSFQDTRASAELNILGFLNVIEAARTQGASRIVYASSAAVYGNPSCLPLRECDLVSPLSPYGIEKLIMEHYAAVLQHPFGISFLGLRYFNVYGPRQSPSSPYSGVITRFVERLKHWQSPIIYGDGLQTRDFVYVRDVAWANLAALESTHTGVCNVSTGTQMPLLTLLEHLREITTCALKPEFAPSTPGDIRHSCGDNSRLREDLAVTPEWTLPAGLRALARSD